MRRQRVGLFLTLMLLLALGVGLLRGQQVILAAAPSTPTVGAPVAQPSTLTVNQTTLVTVTSQITATASNPVSPGSVKIERVDARGKRIATLGTMVDTGTQGDAVAGDGTFTLRVTFTEPAPDPVRLQVSATFRTGGKRVTSAVGLIPVEGNTLPMANAGPGQTVAVGQTVTLDGSGSTDTDGDPLQYQWSFVTRPTGSQAALANPTLVHPTFVVDRRGTYTVQLIVNDGKVDSVPDTVTMATSNTLPVANAGPDQTVAVGAAVTLDGSQSSDADGDPLLFTWSFTQVPSGSLAKLSDPTAVRPTFEVDKSGTYVAQLIVNDGFGNSAPDTVTITNQNSLPVANAGPPQTVSVGAMVTLDGSASNDVDGDPLTFHWTLTTVPTGSTATLANPAAVHPTFVVDKAGTYVAQLIVNDGTLDSLPATVTITTKNSRPVANAGPAQTVLVGTTVTLDGSASRDVDGDPLTFRWALTTTPAGSLATLSDLTAVSPTFMVDKAGPYVAQLIVNDGTLDSLPATVTITTQNSRPVANAGAPQTVVAGTTTVTLDGSASSDADGDPLTFRWALTTVPTGSAATLAHPTAVSPTFVADQVGAYVAQLIVNDGTLDSAPVTVTITANAPPPPPLNAGQITLSGITNGLVTVTGIPGAGIAGTTVTLTNTRTGQTVTGTVQANGSFTLQVAAQGGDALSLIVTDATGQSGSATTVTVGSGLPPDPATVAPPLDRSVVTTLATATSFLYTGSNPIQTGMAPGTIEFKRAAVLRGRVTDRSGASLPGVTLTVLAHPEFGQTLSRADGMFDLAVNGGGGLTLSYAKQGYLPAQRQVQVPWQDYALLPDVALIPLDPQVTPITLSPGAPPQVARGSVVTDADGTRQATLLFPAGTLAVQVLPDGSTQPLSTVSVRATEYTVGPNGPKAMPAALPPTSGYTYALELSADEALAAGATAVRFSQPVIQYVENFLGFPIGGIVPVGSYDLVKAAWVASANGRVIKILSLSGGLAQLDTTGAGSADNGVALGITDAERQHLATLYPAGQSLWRVPIPHFSPWDYNWPYGPPTDATAPAMPSPTQDGPPDPRDCPSRASGSVIGCETQALGEALSMTGTPFSLHYQSERVPGRKAENTLAIPLSGPSVPASLKRIELEVLVAGQRLTQSFVAALNQIAPFTWDGQDVYGRPLQGRQPVIVRIGYVYDAVYQQPGQFAQSFALFSGVPLIGSRARQEVTLWQHWQGSIGAWDARAHGLGGWSLSVRHAYDPLGKVLYFGDGGRRSAEGLPLIITTVAGNGATGAAGAGGGDGGTATQANLYSPRGVAVGPDGSLYIVVSDNRVRRVGPDGIITTVAGIGTITTLGDGGLATQASVSPSGVALGPDGSLYIADQYYHRVRRVGPNGIITTVAGIGTGGALGSFSGDGGLATQASLWVPWGVTVGPDGSLYIADSGNKRIRRVGPDGIITTVAGGGLASPGDGVPATQAIFNDPLGVAVGPDGSLYITDFFDNRVRRVGPDGIITTVAGHGSTYPGDGGPATQVVLNHSWGVAVGPEGSLYIVLGEGYDRVHRVGSDGIITTVAGIGTGGAQGSFSGDGGPATQASLWQASGVAVGPDGSVYIADRDNNRIRRVASALPGSAVSDTVIPAEDGTAARCTSLTQPAVMCAPCMRSQAPSATLSPMTPPAA